MAESEKRSSDRSDPRVRALIDGEYRRLTSDPLGKEKSPAPPPASSVNQRDVAEALFMWTFHAESLPEQVERLRQDLREDLRADYATLYREYVHFRLFVADWVLDSAERRDERMRKVRAAFNQLIALMTREQPHPEEMTKDIDAHLCAYATAANTDHHLGVAWAVATTFCELCGDRGPAKPVSVVTEMSIEFAALAKTVNEMLCIRREPSAPATAPLPVVADDAMKDSKKSSPDLSDLSDPRVREWIDQEYRRMTNVPIETGKIAARLVTPSWGKLAPSNQERLPDGRARADTDPPEVSGSLPYRWGRFFAGQSALAACVYVYFAFSVSQSHVMRLSMAGLAVLAMLQALGLWKKRRFGLIAFLILCIVALVDVIASDIPSLNWGESGGALGPAVLYLGSLPYFLRRRSEFGSNQRSV
jgi:hypothetical protein